MNIFGGKKVIEKIVKPTAIRKGRYTTVPFSKTEGSQQLEDKKSTNVYHLIGRPFPPDSFRSLYEACEPFYATVNQIALDTAGLGFSIQLKEGEEKEDEEEKKKIEKFVIRVNPKQSLFELCNLVLLDWGIVGAGFIQVKRNLEGEVAELYYLRAADMWLHENRKIWCQQVNDKRRYYKEYGDEIIYNAKTGKEEKVDVKNRADEIIVFITHYDKKGCYGIPNILPAASSGISQREIKDYNLSFFRNFAIPAWAVLLYGEWEKNIATNITEFLDEKIKASENAHKTMVLEVPDGGKVEFKQLSGTEKDGSFRSYAETLEAWILMAYSMPPERIGKSIKGTLGGTNIKEHTEIYKQSVIEPLRKKLMFDINFQIIQDGMDLHKYTFVFTPLDTRDLKSDVEMYNTMIERGSLTPNEARQKVGGLESYKDGDKFYISTNLIEVGEAGLEKRDNEEMEMISQINKLHKDITESK